MKRWKKAGGWLIFSCGYIAAFPVTCHPLFAKGTSDDGYEYVTVTGSQMPVRVKKGEAPKPDNVDTMSASQFDQLRQKIIVPPKGGGGM